MFKKLSVLGVLGLLLLPLQAKGQVQDKEAILDFTGHDFNQEKVVLLEGIWEFYWDHLITPGEFAHYQQEKRFVDFPFLWSDQDFPSFGVATYRVQVLLPDEHPALSLEVPDTYTSYRFYINGILFVENGKPALTKADYIPAWSHVQKSLSDLPDSVLGNKLDIVLQVANFQHSKGGTTQEILLGTTDALQVRKIKELAYSWTLTGGLLLAGLFFLGLFVFSSNDRSILYFGLFCLFYTYRVVGFGTYPLHDLIPGVPWIITARLEYASLFISVFFFGLYTYHLYPKEASRVLINILSAICLVFVFLSLFFPPWVFTLSITPFFIILSFYIIYAFYIYVQGTINKRPGSAFALASTGVVFVIFVYQMTDYFGYVGAYPIISFSGHLLFVFLQSLILTYRFTYALKTARSNAEAASRAKTEFLSTMSHEIRTPLNAVIGFSGLLDDGTLNREKREYVRTIRLSGENLLGIINNILDYSKIESGNLDVEQSEVNLQTTIEDVLELLSSLAGKKNLELLYMMDEDVPVIMKTDKTRLQQVLINLVSNAVKFTERGSVIIHIHLNRNTEIPGNICFRVEDTGIGIKEEHMNRLFKRFSQVDSSSTRRYGGTGLGLVISKEIVEILGGEISVKSVFGEGTTFSFTIHSDETSWEYVQPDHSQLQGKRVHIVDDNKPNRVILKKQCDSAGMITFLYEHPRHILDKQGEIKSGDYCILDMQMPDINGVQVAKKIREGENAKDLKLILLSSVHESITVEKKKLFDLILSKPVRQSQLLDHLVSLLKAGYGRDLSDIHRSVLSGKKQSPFSDLSVLITEDNIINQKVTLKILEKLGISADLAENGEEAVVLSKDKNYDLILMDMEMPLLDGVEATREIRKDPDSASQESTIIALTANAMLEDRERCFEAGMNDFLSKPMTLDATFKVLKKWFNSEKE